MTGEDLNKPAKDAFTGILQQSATGRAMADKAVDKLNSEPGADRVDCQNLKTGMSAMDSAAQKVDGYVDKYGGVSSPKSLKEHLSSGSAAGESPKAYATAKKKCGLTKD